MTSPAVTVGPETGFKEVASMLRERAFSAVPVIDATGRAVGVVSEADLMFKEERSSLESDRHVLPGRRTRTARAKAVASRASELMTKPAVTVTADVPLAEAARLMQRHKVKRLPVVDEEGRVVGIVSRGDLLTVFLRPDEELRREIVEDVIRDALMIDPEPIEVTVEGGIVHLQGTVDRRTDARLIERLALLWDGVVDVKSELTYSYDDTHERPAPPREQPVWPLRY